MLRGIVSKDGELGKKGKGKSHCFASLRLQYHLGQAADQWTTQKSWEKEPQRTDQSSHTFLVEWEAVYTHTQRRPKKVQTLWWKVKAGIDLKMDWILNKLPYLPPHPLAKGESIIGSRCLSRTSNQPLPAHYATQTQRPSQGRFLFYTKKWKHKKLTRGIMGCMNIGEPDFTDLSLGNLLKTKQ